MQYFILLYQIKDRIHFMAVFSTYWLAVRAVQLEEGGDLDEVVERVVAPHAAMALDAHHPVRFPGRVLLGE